MGNSIEFFEGIFPSELNIKLNSYYNELKINYVLGKHEPSELNAAKFCEIISRILEWHTNPDSSYTPLSDNIRNFEDSTRKFENLSQFPDSIRFHIPKLISTLYKFRNKRGVTHVSGDVNPNKMDSTFIVSACDWVMAELVRLFHDVSLIEAQSIVDSLVEKKYPVIWEIGEVKRYLRTDLTYKQKTLALLYSEQNKSVNEDNLFKWVEHSNKSVFRRDVLRQLHKDRKIEYNSETKIIAISPKGIKEVEDKSLLKTDF